MTVVAVTMVKDEADIVGRTVAHMLEQVDAVIVADNGSTDATRPILEELAADWPTLTVVDDHDPAYRQSAKMTALALRARLELGADWIVPFDADEWWYSPFGTIREILDGIAPQWLVAPAPLYDHVATGEDPTAELDPIARIGWRRRSPNPLPKVACRWREDLVIEQGNHGAYYDGGATRFDEQLVVRHFPYRSVDQLVRKITNGAAAYTAAGDSVPDVFGTHWREWGQLLEAHGERAIRDLFFRWHWRDDPRIVFEIEGEVQSSLIFDPAPGL